MADVLLDLVDRVLRSGPISGPLSSAFTRTPMLFETGRQGDPATREFMKSAESLVVSGDAIGRLTSCLTTDAKGGAHSVLSSW